MKIDNSLQTTSISVDESTGTGRSNEPMLDGPALMPELNQLLCSGDPGAMLAALTVQSARTQEDSARKTRDEAMSAQEKADEAAVRDLHDKADLERVQGIFDGAMQIAQGACELGSGLNGIAAESAKTGAANEQEMEKNGYAQSGEQRAAMESCSQSRTQDALGYETSAAWDRAGASAYAAGRSIGDGLFSGAITDKDADEKTREASADSFKKIADDAHDAQNDAKQLLNKAIDFYKEYLETKNQTVMAALHRA